MLAAFRYKTSLFPREVVFSGSRWENKSIYIVLFYLLFLVGDNNCIAAINCGNATYLRNKQCVNIQN
jgi:hypothetical protein